jgi:hypothetical protein
VEIKIMSRKATEEIYDCLHDIASVIIENSIPTLVGDGKIHYKLGKWELFRSDEKSQTAILWYASGYIARLSLEEE